ncbi:MAG: ferrous iron transport protein B [Ignavibacteria bacterium]|jgi:ferrous iron transport protein B
MNNDREILVALAGNPNSGKTSIFNNLVGANQKVGNFAGVTVEKYTGRKEYKGYKINFVDLPGTYSLTAYSPEEVVARNFIIEEKPDLIINVIDSTNLERNLFLTTQLMDLECKMIVALNMFDEIERKNIKIDTEQLNKLLGTPIVKTSATKKTGINDLLDFIIKIKNGELNTNTHKLYYSDELEEQIEKIQSELDSCKHLNGKYNYRWLSIKLLENDKIIYNLVKENPVWLKINPILTEAITNFDSKYDSEPEMLLTEERYSLIRGAIKETVSYPPKRKKSKTEIVDSILINRITGLPIFLFFMWAMFQLTFTLGEYPMGLIEDFFGLLGEFASDILTNEIVRSIVVDGIIAGVGGVLVFLPNILILFLCLSIFEGTGYLARAAFVIDKVMHKFGLHGKSFIPMVTGFGCSVPAFMATRTLKSESDKITTMLIIPFMSCSAKFPVYILITGAFFAPEVAGNILFGIYLFGVGIALLSAKFFKKTIFDDESEPFVMELPPYRVPTLKTLIMQMWFKAALYLRKAGTIILFASVLIWISTNYPVNKELEQQYENEIETVQMNNELSDEFKAEKIAEIENNKQKSQLEYSAAGYIGKFIEPFFSPLGFDWRLSISLVNGFAAKEIVVSTMGTIYALGGDADESSSALRERLRNDGNYTIATALALMIFTLLYIPCFAATVVFHKEAGKWKWTLLYASYSIAVAWIMAFIVYNVTSLFL